MFDGLRCCRGRLAAAGLWMVALFFATPRHAWAQG